MLQTAVLGIVPTQKLNSRATAIIQSPAAEFGIGYQYWLQSEASILVRLKIAAV